MEAWLIIIAYLYAGLILALALRSSIRSNWNGDDGQRFFIILLCICLWPLYPIAYLMD